MSGLADELSQSIAAELALVMVGAALVFHLIAVTLRLIADRAFFRYLAASARETKAQRDLQSLPPRGNAVWHARRPGEAKHPHRAHQKPRMGAATAKMERRARETPAYRVSYD